MLDDFQEIEEPTTRSDTPLLLYRLRLAGEVSEIVADDLAFSSAELATLATLARLDVDGADLDRILDRTDGWPAGVRLATLHLTRPGAARDLLASEAATARGVLSG